MKSLLFPLLAILVLPKAVNAEIWIDLSNYYEGLGEGIRYIDVTSIYKRGDWIYARKKIGSQKINNETPQPRVLKVNCKKGILIEDTGSPYLQTKRLGDGYWRLRFISSKSRNPELDGTYNFLCKKKRFIVP